MNANFKTKLWKYALGFILFFFGFLLAFPFFFKDKLKAEIEKTLANQVQAELQVEAIGLSFFRHFPSLTLTMDNLYLGGSAPFDSDTLLFTRDLSLGLSIPSLFSDKIKINEIYLDQATIKLLRDTEGMSNFDIFQTSSADTSTLDSSTFTLEIESFFFENSRFLYQDTSLDLICEANEINYKGSGNLENEQFNLNSNIQIDQFNLIFGDLPIFNDKRMQADLLTRINTETTALIFERNALKINDLPVNFVGAFEFIPGGYDMNFVLESFDANLKDMMSLVPKEFVPQLEQTRFGGKGDIVGSLQGMYLPEQNQMPALALNFKLDQGMISQSAAGPAIENLSARVNLRIPDLDPNLLILDVDSLGFELEDGFFKGKVHLESLENMKLDSDIEAKIDLQLLDDALGTESLDYRGIFEFKFHSEGRFAEATDPNDLRDPSPVLVRTPAFSISASLKNGFLHWVKLPESIRDLEIELQADSPDGFIENINFELRRLHFQALDQATDGYFNYWGRQNHEVDGNLKSKIDLATIEKFYPLDSGYQLAGVIDLDIQASGNYIPSKNILPQTKADFSLTGGRILTPHYPEPITDLSCIVSVANSAGTFKDFNISISPVSFTFAGNPFLLKADLANLDDIQYELQSQGRLDLGKLYQVFGVKGVDLEGFLNTDLNLKGLQSDAAAGRISQLNNSGKIEIEKIQVRSELLPEAFKLQKGVLDFNQDKLEFQDFLLEYAGNQFSVSGYLTNYLGYLTTASEVLSGNMAIKTSYIDLEDFMFFGEESPGRVDTLGKVSGVIVPPSNLNLKLSASADSIRFGEYAISDFNGSLSTSPGLIRLDQTTFGLVGAQVLMKGSYQAQTPYTAYFDYQIEAQDFDIQRAYQEIPIFREMVTFAEYAEGKAALEYQLSGRLDANMYPVFPSIKGQGILGLKAIKLNGFKLMNTMAEKTENEQLKDPELNDIEIQTTIANNLITIPKTRMKIAGFRPRMEGQVSLDGDLNIGVRLGLPPLGIIGIPVKITGNAEDFQMKVGKSTKADELEETLDEINTNEN